MKQNNKTIIIDRITLIEYYYNNIKQHNQVINSMINML